jgi:phosphoadenosine phosphosulfate reductase
MLNHLFGNRVDDAIERLKEFEQFTKGEGYYLAFSGGKDSCVIKALADMAGVKYDAHYNVTTVDPPELLRFIKEHHTDVIWERPKTNMWQLIIKKRMPPSRIVRYCCEMLKEGNGGGRVIMTGVRWAESAKRSKRRMVETCYKDKGKRYVHPIIDWTSEDVWEFIREYNVPYCGLYDEGFTRLGCIGCPIAGKKRWAEFERWPRFKELYLRAFNKCVEKRLRDIKDGESHLEYKGDCAKWSTGQEMFDWWMKDRHEKVTDGGMFE